MLADESTLASRDTAEPTGRRLYLAEKIGALTSGMAILFFMLWFIVKVPGYQLVLLAMVNLLLLALTWLHHGRKWDQANPPSPHLDQSVGV